MKRIEKNLRHVNDRIKCFLIEYEIKLKLHILNVLIIHIYAIFIYFKPLKFNSVLKNQQKKCNSKMWANIWLWIKRSFFAKTKIYQMFFMFFMFITDTYELFWTPYLNVFFIWLCNFLSRLGSFVCLRK